MGRWVAGPTACAAAGPIGRVWARPAPAKPFHVKRFIPRVNPVLGFPPVENLVEKVKNPVFWRRFFHKLPVFHGVFNALWKTDF